MNQKIQATLLLLCSLSLSSCSLVSQLGKEDSDSHGRVEPFMPGSDQEHAAGLPEFGRTSLMEPETFVLKYSSVAELSSLLGAGKASWYGRRFQGRMTASGERYNMNEMTAAHPNLPFGTLVWVENQNNGLATMVRINDRGPYASGRIIDLSWKAAQTIGMTGTGLAQVKIYHAKKYKDRRGLNNETPQAYTIQLGSFETVDRALSFARTIKKARVEIVQENGRTYYGVFYGLYTNRNTAFRKQRALQKQKDFTGLVKELDVFDLG